MKRGTKPNYKKDKLVLELRDNPNISKDRRTFRAIASRTKEDVKNVYIRYKRAGGKLIGRLK